MRMKFLTGSAVLVLGMLGASGAMAQSQTIGAPLAGMTCADFAALSPAAQTDAVNKGVAASSLTSNSSTTPASDSKTAAAVGTPLAAGQLIAACQAGSPTSTLQDALSHFSSGSTPAPAVAK